MLLCVYFAQLLFSVFEGTCKKYVGRKQEGIFWKKRKGMFWEDAEDNVLGWK
jgi:hypothetical protein